MLTKLISTVFDIRPEVITPWVSANDITPPGQTSRVAIIVGHHEKAQGAVNYLGETEWAFNKRIAQKVVNICKDKHSVKAFVVLRPPGSYSYQCKAVAQECERLGIEYALELHFNSAMGSTGRGCEALSLYSAGPIMAPYRLADWVTDVLKTQLGLSERFEDGVLRVNEKHNGYGMLKALEAVAVVASIVEPCFAQYRHDESEQVFAHEDKYAECLAFCVGELSHGKAPCT